MDEIKASPAPFAVTLSASAEKKAKKERKKEKKEKEKKEKKEKKKRRRTAEGNIGDGKDIDADGGGGGGGGGVETTPEKKERKRSRIDDSGAGVDVGFVDSSSSLPLHTDDDDDDGVKKVAAAMDLAEKNGGSSSSSSPFRIQTLAGSVSVLPASLADVRAAAIRGLNSKLLTYNANMEGMLLAFDRNAVELTSSGRIMDDLPHVHYEFKVRCLAFSPKVGMRLQGTVEESNSSHVTLSVHRILTMRLPSSALRSSGYAFDHSLSVWTREGNEDELTEQPCASVGLGDVVEAEVSRIHECGGVISLDGREPRVTDL